MCLGTICHRIVRFRAKPSGGQRSHQGLVVYAECSWITVRHSRGCLSPMSDVKVGQASTSQAVEFISEWCYPAVKTDPLWGTVSVERKNKENDQVYQLSKYWSAEITHRSLAPQQGDLIVSPSSVLVHTFKLK